MRRLIALTLLLSGCYQASYVTLDAQGVETLDATDRVELAGHALDASPHYPGIASPTAHEIEAYADAAIARAGMDSEVVPCVERFVVVLSADVETFEGWCGPGRSACMCPTGECARADLDGRWLMVLRPEHAHLADLAAIVEHEVTHAALWCATGDADASHRSNAWRSLTRPN